MQARALTRGQSGRLASATTYACMAPVRARIQKQPGAYSSATEALGQRGAVRLTTGPCEKQRGGVGGARLAVGDGG